MDVIKLTFTLKIRHCVCVCVLGGGGEAIDKERPKTNIHYS